MSGHVIPMSSENICTTPCEQGVCPGSLSGSQTVPSPTREESVAASASLSSRPPERLRAALPPKVKPENQAEEQECLLLVS